MPEPFTAIAAIGAVAGGISASNQAKKQQKAARANFEQQAAISDEQLKLAKEQYADYLKIYQPIILDSLGDDSKYRKEDRAFYLENYRPLEVDLVEDSLNDDRENYMTGEALSRVDQSAEIGRDSLNRNLQGDSIDPSSGRSILMNQDLNYEQANNRGIGVNNARLGERDRVFSKQAGILGKGAGLQRPPINTNIPLDPNSIVSSFGNAAQQAGANANTNLALANNYNNLSGQYGQAGANLFLRGLKYNGTSGGGAPIPTIGGGFADGGPVSDGANDSQVITANDPQVLMENGDYIIPEDVVKIKGSDFFDGLVFKVLGDSSDSSEKLKRGK